MMNSSLLVFACVYLIIYVSIYLFSLFINTDKVIYKEKKFIHIIKILIVMLIKEV